jgi:hypothetical protein
MLEEAKSLDFTTILSTTAGIRAVTRWFLDQGILGQFSIAQDMVREDRAEGLQQLQQGTTAAGEGFLES